MKSLKDFIVEGAWGYGSLDNDSVLDDRDKLIDNLHKEFMSMIRHNLGSTDGCWNNIGLIDWYCESMIALRIDYWLNDDKNEIFDIYQNSINMIKQDPKWVEDWKEPERMRKALELADKKLVKHQQALDQSRSKRTGFKFKVAIDNN